MAVTEDCHSHARRPTGTEETRCGGSPHRPPRAHFEADGGAHCRRCSSATGFGSSRRRDLRSFSSASWSTSFWRCQCRRFRRKIAEVVQFSDTPVPPIKEEFVDLVRFIPQQQIQGRIVEQTVIFSAPPIKEEIVQVVLSGMFGRHSNVPRATDQGENRGMCQAPPQEHIRAHIEEQTLALLVPQISDKNRGCVSGSVFQERIHEHMADPSCLRSAVVGSGKWVNLAATLGRSRLKWRWHGREKRKMSSFTPCRKMRPRRSGQPKCIFGRLRRCLSSS